MKVGELITYLQQFDPERAVLTTWEGQLLSDVSVKPLEKFDLTEEERLKYSGCPVIDAEPWAHIEPLKYYRPR